MSVDHMLISILTASGKVQEMSCAVVAETLAPQAWDLNLDDLLSPCVLCAPSGIQTCPVSNSDIPSSPSGPVQTLIASASRNISLRLKPGLAHLDRQLATVGELLPDTLLPCFVLEKFISFVVQLLMIHQVNNRLLIRISEIDVGHVPLLVSWL